MKETVRGVSKYVLHKQKPYVKPQKSSSKDEIKATNPKPLGHELHLDLFLLILRIFVTHVAYETVVQAIPTLEVASGEFQQGS